MMPVTCITCLQAQHTLHLTAHAVWFAEICCDALRGLSGKNGEAIAKLEMPRQTNCAVSVQLKVKIMRQQAAREQKLRRKNLTKYIPNAAAAVFKVLQSMAQAPAVGSKRRRLQAEEDILEPVTRGETVEATLAQRLTEYVERIDTDMVSTVQTRSMHRAVRLYVMAVLAQPEGHCAHHSCVGSWQKLVIMCWK